VYCAPVHVNDPTLAAHHASLKDVLTWVKGSPPVSVTTGHKSSRLLQKSSRAGGKCFWTKVLASVPIDIEMGSVSPQSVPRIQVTQHLLTAKTTRKVLKAQESLFKYGTFVPRNDKEAEKSPEAI
jgi:hypothetical protein